MPAPRRPRVLVVDDRLEMAEMVAEGLGDRGYEAIAISSSEHALLRLKAETFDALVTDLRMPKVDGLDLLAASRKLSAERPVLVMTAYGAIDSAIESIRLGAYHYLTKPFKMEELAVFLDRALEESRLRLEAKTLKETLRAHYGPVSVIAKSASMRRALDVIERVAPTDAGVLLLGETGTGKGLLAQVLHTLSPRSSRRLVTVNCAALPEPLLESELFGHVRGAFTGATAERPGLFVEADEGTLFLDEIGEMTPALQAKLLHVLETGYVRPVGSSQERSVNVRILSATHRNLRERIATGAFREDLLYRLEIVTVEIPPLRERREDLLALVEHFLGRARAKYPFSPVQRLSAEALGILLDHRWPGNVRELAHVLERMVLLGQSDEIPGRDLPSTLFDNRPRSGVHFAGEIVPIRELQRLYASWALERFEGNKSRTAERLEVDVKTLGKWLTGATSD